MKKFSFPLVILALAVSAFAADTVVEEIIVRINNAIITRSDLERARQQLKTEQQDQNPAQADETPAEREKNVLRDLIDNQLLVQKATDLGISADTDLIKQLDDYRKRMGLNTLEDLEKEAAKQGVSYEDFRQNLKNNILMQKVIQQEIGPHVHVTQDEEHQYYEAHKKEMEQPEQVRLSEILVSTEPKAADPNSNESNAAAEPDAATLETAHKKADAAVAEIKAGASFEDVAKKVSEGPTAAEGGDLGYFKPGMLAKELEDKTFHQMKQGEVSDVIRTKQGFVILKVTEHTQAGVPSYDQVEERLQQVLFYQKLQPLLRDYLTKLREEAYIVVKPGYIDTGASPNQTIPVVASADSSTTDKAPEKKKKKFLIF